MKLANKFFGKNLDELKYEDIENYFQQARIESNHLEYKSYNSKGDISSKLKGIFRVICAMLNSDGGIIVWGAPEGESVKGRKEKAFSGDLTPIDKIIEKDDLINRISDNIIPVPNLVRVAILEKENKCVVVIEVLRSEYAPHQTQDVYYMRLDGQTRAAPHYLIEALFNRRKFPKLGGYIKFETMFLDKKYHVIPFSIYVLNHTPSINEEKVFFELEVKNAPLDEKYLSADTEVSFYDNNLICWKFVDVLSFGSKPSCQCAIKYFHTRITGFKPGPIKLTLKFGGRQSPLQKSEYILIEPGKLALPPVVKVEHFLKESNENQTVTENEINIDPHDQALQDILSIDGSKL